MDWPLAVYPITTLLVEAGDDLSRGSTKRSEGYDLNRDQQDYLQTLTVFVERYESEHEQTQVSLDSVRGIDVLRSLLAEHDMSGADVSRLLGATRALGPMILRGEHCLTRHHARLLGEHFRVDPGVLIGGPPRSTLVTQRCR